MGTGLFIRALLSLAVIAIWTVVMISALSVMRVPRKYWEPLVVLPPLILGVVVTAYSVVTEDWGLSRFLIIAILTWAGAYLVAKRLRLWG